METEELELALDELEIRLERLRALYEQYFLGIEKLEPQVARKDVDRRIFVLRREKIRNTGRRFKLQTLIQRYNTFQQYWQRICREIENGTYRRHVLRAEKTVGPSTLLTVAARRRFGKERARSDQPPEPEASQLAEPVADETTHRFMASAAAATSEESGSDEVLGRPRSRVPTLPGLSSAPPPPLPGVTPLAPPPALSARTARPAMPTPPPRAAVPPPAAPGATRSSRAPTPFESLELDMDFMGDWDPGTAGRGRSPLGDARPPARPKSEPLPEPARRLAPPPKPVRAPTPDAKPDQAEPAARKPVAASPPARPEGPTAAIGPKPAAASTAASPAMARPPAAAKSAPAASPSPAAKPAPSATPAPAPAASTAERPPKPAKPLDPQPQPQKAARAAKPAGDAGAVDGKMKELHQRFVEASKSAGQPAVSYEGLQKSLRAAEAKLREKHGNRRIDFEVVLKDGKPVVKPVVR